MAIERSDAHSLPEVLVTAWGSGKFLSITIRLKRWEDVCWEAWMCGSSTFSRIWEHKTKLLSWLRLLLAVRSGIDLVNWIWRCLEMTSLSLRWKRCTEVALNVISYASCYIALWIFLTLEKLLVPWSFSIGNDFCFPRFLCVETDALSLPLVILR